MRRSAKAKSATPRLPLRKAALSASAAARRGYPAWIDSDERSVVFTARSVSPRVRDALVLRQVPQSRPSKTVRSSDARRPR